MSRRQENTLKLVQVQIKTQVITPKRSKEETSHVVGRKIYIYWVQKPQLQKLDFIDLGGSAFPSHMLYRHRLYTLMRTNDIGWLTGTAEWKLSD